MTTGRRDQPALEPDPAEPNQMRGDDARSIRLDFSFGSVALVLGAIAVALLVAGVLVEARRIISWVVACAVVAALIELVIEWLDRWINRAVAVVLTLFTLAGLAGLLVFGVFQDLDDEARRLKVEAPLAAQRVEANEQLGGLAREIDLDGRVTEAVFRLSSPSSGLTSDAVNSAGAYVVCTVLTVLFLSWGPRLGAAGLRQLDARDARSVRWIVHSAFSRSRRYVGYTILQAVIVGAIGWGVCTWLDFPAPLPLALALTACALVPSIGIVLGSLPMLLLAAGLETGATAVAVAAGVLALQVLSNRLVLPRVVSASKLDVGSAAVVVGALVGFELYGIGGALYASALTVMAIALIDAKTEHETIQQENARREAAEVSGT